MKYILLVFILVGLTACHKFIIKNETDEKISVGSTILNPNECEAIWTGPIGDLLVTFSTVGDNPVEFDGKIIWNHYVIKEVAQNEFAAQVSEIEPNCSKTH